MISTWRRFRIWKRVLNYFLGVEKGGQNSQRGSQKGEEPLETRVHQIWKPNSKRGGGELARVHARGHLQRWVAGMWRSCRSGGRVLDRSTELGLGPRMRSLLEQRKLRRVSAALSVGRGETCGTRQGIARAGRPKRGGASVVRTRMGAKTRRTSRTNVEELGSDRLLAPQKLRMRTSS